MADKGKFKITYFNGTGRGEVCRWILAFNKVSFEDNRIARPDWPKLKLTMPLGQMPVLEWTSADGKQKMTLCQSGAIVRFLSELFGVRGKTPIEVGKANEAFESLKEFMEGFFVASFEPDPERKKVLMEKAVKETGPRMLGFLEKRLQENGGKNLAGGDGYTFADIYVGSFFETMNLWKAYDFTPYPGLSALAKTIAESEGVKAYLANRPKLDF